MIIMLIGILLIFRVVNITENWSLASGLAVTFNIVHHSNMI